MKQEHQEDDDGEDKRLSIKQKDERKFLDGRVAKNVSIRKQKREVRLASSRAYKEKDGEDDETFECAFTNLVAQDLPAACKKTFDYLGQTDKPDVVETGLRWLWYLVKSPHCQPNHPEVFRIFPPLKLTERLCVVLKTKEESLQEHVKRAAQCIAQIAQAHKMGDLEYQWSNAIVHAGLIKVMGVHILQNPDTGVRTHMLHAAIHFVDRSGQNAKDAALMPVMRQLLAQKLPQTYEYITWYVASVCKCKTTLDWTEMVGNELWTLVVHVFKTAVNDQEETLMIEDVAVALSNCIERGDIFARTCKEVRKTQAALRAAWVFEITFE
jgi:hypothetical protein